MTDCIHCQDERELWPRSETSEVVVKLKKLRSGIEKDDRGRRRRKQLSNPRSTQLSKKGGRSVSSLSGGGCKGHDVGRESEWRGKKERSRQGELPIRVQLEVFSLDRRRRALNRAQAAGSPFSLLKHHH